jgi:hypothetical protein
VRARLSLILAECSAVQETLALRCSFQVQADPAFRTMPGTMPDYGPAGIVPGFNMQSRADRDPLRCFYTNAARRHVPDESFDSIPLTQHKLYAATGADAWLLPRVKSVHSNQIGRYQPNLRRFLSAAWPAGRDGPGIPAKGSSHHPTVSVGKPHGAALVLQQVVELEGFR